MKDNTILFVAVFILTVTILGSAVCYLYLNGSINFNVKLIQSVPVGTWEYCSSVVTFYDNSSVAGWTSHDNVTWSKSGNEIDLLSDGKFFTSLMYDPSSDCISGYARV